MVRLLGLCLGTAEPALVAIPDASMFLPLLGVQCGVYTELGLAAEGWMLCSEVTLSKKSVGANLSKPGVCLHPLCGRVVQIWLCRALECHIAVPCLLTEQLCGAFPVCAGKTGPHCLGTPKEILGRAGKPVFFQD